MSDPIHVARLCGSLAAESGTRTSIRTALNGAIDSGAQTTLVNFRDYDLLTFDSGKPDAGDAITLRNAIRGAVAVLLGSPVYHGLVSSPLKTALDNCRREDFEGKTIGHIVVSDGRFPRPVLAHLREISLALDAWPVSSGVCVPNSGSVVEGCQIRDESLIRRLRQLGTTVTTYAGVSKKLLSNDTSGLFS